MLSRVRSFTRRHWLLLAPGLAATLIAALIITAGFARCPGTGPVTVVFAGAVALTDTLAGLGICLNGREPRPIIYGLIDFADYDLRGGEFESRGPGVIGGCVVECSSPVWSCSYRGR
jgi:hypothetical protein